jgi:hypothetical protein
MMVEVVDQRDIQRMGGLYARFPQSHVVCKLLRSINARRVLDVTYGVGRFYRLCRSWIELLVASDPVRWEWVVAPDTFYQLTVWQLYDRVKHGDIVVPRVDVVVCDPPRWNTSVSYNRRGPYNYIVGTPSLIIDYSVKLARTLNVKHFLLHYNRVLNIGKPLHVIEFHWFARYLNTEGKNKSYYILYDVSSIDEQQSIEPTFGTLCT